MSLFSQGIIDRFEISQSDLKLIEEVYRHPASLRKFERLIISPRFFEEFNFIAQRGTSTFFRVVIDSILLFVDLHFDVLFYFCKEL